jgi:hypothetical protein
MYAILKVLTRVHVGDLLLNFAKFRDAFEICHKRFRAVVDVRNLLVHSFNSWKGFFEEHLSD